MDCNIRIDPERSFRHKMLDMIVHVRDAYDETNRLRTERFANCIAHGLYMANDEEKRLKDDDAEYQQSKQ